MAKLRTVGGDISPGELGINGCTFSKTSDVHAEIDGQQHEGRSQDIRVQSVEAPRKEDRSKNEGPC